MGTVDTHVVERWTALFRSSIDGWARPDEEAKALDATLSGDGNPSQRLGLWLSLLERDSPAHRYEALCGLAGLVNLVRKLPTNTGLLLVSRLAEDDLWLKPFAIEKCVAIVARLAEINPFIADEAVAYAQQLVDGPWESVAGLELVVRYAELTDEMLDCVNDQFPLLDMATRTQLRQELEHRISAEKPEAFVPYAVGLFARWDRFDADARAVLLRRITPILNSEIRRDFVKISATAFDRVGGAIAEAPGMDDDSRRSLIAELVPHSRDLAKRQPLAPPLAQRLVGADESVLDRVFENAQALDPLASAGFLINVAEVLKVSPLRFKFAERLLTAYRGYDLVHRAATIDVLGREMWRFLGDYAQTDAADVEGLAEASEPHLDALEIELVEQFQSEIQALRLRSFPRI